MAERKPEQAGKYDGKKGGTALPDINAGENEIEKNGMHGLVPDKKYQRIVMDIIYKDIKAGKIPDIEKYNVVATHLKNKGAQVIILGCTELSLLKKQYDIKTGVIDAMEVLAKSSLIQCNKRVKPKYNKLFVPFN